MISHLPMFLRVAIGVVIAAVIAAGQKRPVESMTTDYPFIQLGAPIQVAGVTLNVDKLDLADRVTLVNLSSKTVVRYQLGWIYREQGADVQGDFQLGRVSDILLRPNSATTTGSQGIGMNTAASIFKQRGIQKGEVVIGVVYVQFDDGSQWNYPLTVKRRFEQREDPGLREKIAPLIQQERARLKSIGAIPRRTNSNASCANANRSGSLWNTFTSALRNWTQPVQVQAQSCDRCWTVVCNPGTKTCNASGAGTCSNDPCIYGCTTACGVVPTCCPGCGC